MKQVKRLACEYLPEILAILALFVTAISITIGFFTMPAARASTEIPESIGSKFFKSITLTNLIQPREYDIPEEATSFKTYMDYTAISDKTSKQYQLQQNAWTDSDGLRRFGPNGLYMVAMGTYYADECGKIFDVTFESGTTIRCIVGDIKDDRHTDKLHQHRNGNVVEFIVETQAMNRNCRVMGDISWAEHVDLTGKPVLIKAAFI